MTDGGVWYPEACRWARLEHHVYGTELKNLIERMNQALKDRLECFDDLFPCLRKECDREHVRNWISVFRFYHNHVRTNGGIERAPMEYDDGPEYLRFIRLITQALTAPVFSTQSLNIAKTETILLQIRLMLIQDWLRRENDEASDSLKTTLLWKQEIK